MCIRDSISTLLGKSLDNEFIGNVIDVCPVGALTDKTFRFKNRVWFTKPVDAHCDCKTSVSYTHLDVYKRQMMNNLYNGTIDYLKIASTDEQVTIDGNTGCIRATLEIDVIMEGKTLPFRLHGLEVWVWKLSLIHI